MSEHISPGDGYRLLDLGETVIEGDEYLYKPSDWPHGKWFSAAYVIGKPVCKTWRPIRRPTGCPIDNLPTRWTKFSERMPSRKAPIWVCSVADGTPFLLQCGLDRPEQAPAHAWVYWMPAQIPDPPKPEKSEVQIEAEKYAESLSRTVDKQAAVKDFISGAQWAMKVWRDT